MTRRQWMLLLIPALILVLVVIASGRRESRSSDAIAALLTQASDPLEQSSERRQHLAKALEGIVAGRRAQYLDRVTALIRAEGDFPRSGNDRLAQGIDAWLVKVGQTRPLDGLTLARLCALLEGMQAPELAAAHRRRWLALVAPTRARVDALLEAAALAMETTGEHERRAALAQVNRSWESVRAQARLDGLEITRDPTITSAARTVQNRLLERLQEAVDERMRGELRSLETVLARSPVFAREAFLLAGLTESLAAVMPEDGSDTGHPADALARRIRRAAPAPLSAWAVLLALLIVPGALALIALWRRSAGPVPVDPAAETLENVDPIDLDTEAVTLSGDHTAAGEPTTTEGAPVE